MVAAAGAVRRPGRLRNLRRENARRAEIIRSRPQSGLSGDLSGTDVPGFRIDPAIRRRQSAVHRRPRCPRSAKPAAQSGGRMGPLHACRGRTGRQRLRPPLPGRRGQHARHSDREVSPFAGWPHAEHPREVLANGHSSDARLSRWPGHDGSAPRHRQDVFEFDAAGVAAGLWRDHRSPRGAMDLVRHRCRRCDPGAQFGCHHQGRACSQG